MEIVLLVPDLLCEHTAVGFGYRGRVKGEKGRDELKRRRENEREEERGKERGKEIPGPDSSIDPAHGPRGRCPGLGAVPSYWVGFLHPSHKDKFLTFQVN